MKLFLIASLCAFPLLANACPDLSGHFLCKDFDSGTQQDIVMSQTVANGVTTYKMTLTAEGKTTSQDYIADGVVREVEKADYSSRTFKSYCDGSNLMTEINSVKRDNGEVLSAIELVTVNKDGDMYDSYHGKQGAKELHFEEVCVRVAN